MRVGWLVLNIIFCFLTGAFAPPVAVAAPAGGDQMTVNAVFQSARGGMVLIDGVAYRPGDRVRGAEILAVERGAVRLRTGDGDYTAWVGFDLADGYAPLPEAPATLAPEPIRVATGPVTPDAAPAAPPQADAEAGMHVVAYGETLSTIAQHYRPAGVALDIVISALFEANSGIIGDDIDRIYAGSALHIPEFNAPDGLSDMLASVSHTPEQSPHPAAPAIARGYDSRLPACQTGRRGP